jgi:radical SAM superfamily enzyme YgiQ (UPF0313 family)
VRIVFVDNLLLEHGAWTYNFDLQPHLGLISLIAVAEREGHEGVLFDPKLSVWRGDLPLDASLYREMAHAIMRSRPDIVGFTSLGCNFICTLKVAAYLKDINRDLPILLGGPHASILDRQIMNRFPQFDVLVRGEAEETLLPTVEGICTGRLDGIPGITHRSGGEVVAEQPAPIITNLDSLPWPAYDHYPIEDLDIKTIRVEAGRGCPFDCTFCSTASFFGRRYRLKTAERLCAELDHLSEQYNISQFALMHDLFTVSKVKVREFCEAVQGRGYTWKCSARMDCVDGDLLAQMYEAGCRSIYYGVETGSPRMQKTVSKRLDLNLYEPILDATIELGISPTASFITGYPEEEKDDQDLTLDLIESSLYRYPESLTIQLHLLTPEPGTGLINKFADALAYDGHISDFNFPTLEADDTLIMRACPEVFMNHHYYQGRISRARHVLVTSGYLHLYKLGFPLLKHLIDNMGNSLSGVFEEMADWGARNNRGPRVDPCYIIDFLTDRLGSEDYIVSLVRHRFAATELGRRVEEAERSARQATPEREVASDQLEMSPGVTILRDIHCCPEILELLSHPRTADVEIPERLRTQRTHCAIYQEHSVPRKIRNFRLNEWSAQLLEYFAESRSYGEFLRDFGSDLRSARGTPAPDSVIAWLLKIGILRPVRDTVLKASGAGMEQPVAAPGSQG